MLHSYFFYHDTATTEIYTLSLHDALPILSESVNFCVMEAIKLCRLDTPIIIVEARINLSRFVVTGCAAKTSATVTFPSRNLLSLFAFCFNIWLIGVASLPSLVSWIKHSVDDRKSGSAGRPRPISYAVFCLKKKKKK